MTTTGAGLMEIVQAPSGGLEVEEEVYDEERIREQEATMSAGGRTSVVTVAQDRGGEVVAYTGAVGPDRREAPGLPVGNARRPAHRGRRLGFAVKVANHRLLQD